MDDSASASRPSITDSGICEDDGTFTLWMYKYVGLLSWSDNLVEIGSGPPEKIMRLISKVGGLPSALSDNDSLFIFREDIEPMWEDPQNREGGRMLINIQEESRLDEAFVRTIMLLFQRGCSDSHGDWYSVTGVSLSRKKRGGRLYLWTRDASDKSTNLSLQTQLASALDFAVHEFKYTSHKRRSKNNWPLDA